MPQASGITISRAAFTDTVIIQRQSMADYIDYIWCWIRLSRTNSVSSISHKALLYDACTDLLRNITAPSLKRISIFDI